MMMRRSESTPLDHELSELHDSYVWQANAAVAAGRDDLAQDLAQEFPDEALAMLSRGRT